MTVRYGQLVIGPPGSGKSTYCRAMADLLRAQSRPISSINLDPANEPLHPPPHTAPTPSPHDIDCSSLLVSASEVMRTHRLGPNGALVYCMQFIVDNFECLAAQLARLPDNCYVLIDCPGQIELYTHYKCVPELVAKLEKLDFRLTAVNLVDSHQCADPGKYIASIITCLSTMLHVAMPHIHLLSKLDLIEKQLSPPSDSSHTTDSESTNKLSFGLEFYTEVLDLRQLLHLFSAEPLFTRYRHFQEALIGVAEQYGLVSFLPVCATDRRLLARALTHIDRANGCVFRPQSQQQAAAGDGEQGNSAESSNFSALFSSATVAESQQERLGAAADLYMG